MVLREQHDSAFAHTVQAYIDSIGQLPTSRHDRHVDFSNSDAIDIPFGKAIRMVDPEN